MAWLSSRRLQPERLPSRLVAVLNAHTFGKVLRVPPLFGRDQNAGTEALVHITPVRASTGATTMELLVASWRKANNILIPNSKRWNGFARAILRRFTATTAWLYRSEK